MPAYNKLFYFFITAVIFLFSPKVVLAGNLLQNPGFEELLLNWETTSGLEIGVNFTTSSYVKRNGEYSALIKHDKTGSYGAQQIVTGIVGGKDYSWEGYVFFNDDNAKNSRIRIAWYSSDDGSGPQIKTVDSNIVESTSSSWQKLSVGSVESPNEAKSAKFRILLASSEKDTETLVYFDNLIFEKIDSPTLTPTPTPTPTLTPTNTPVPTSTLALSSLTPTSSSVSSSTPTPTTNTDYPSGIILTEFMPDPDTDEQEWVEIKNTGSSEAILTNWQIDDIADGGGSPRDFSATISSGGYHKIEISGWLFNNAGDSVRLLKPDDTLVDETSYSYSSDGISWVEIDDNWCEAESSTPSEANSSCRAGSALTPTSTPTKTPTPTKKLTSNPTPTKPVSQLSKKSATLSGEILGEKATRSVNLIKFPQATEDGLLISTPSGFKKAVGGIFFFLGGLSILGAVAFPLIKKNLNKKNFNKEKDNY